MPVNGSGSLPAKPLLTFTFALLLINQVWAADKERIMYSFAGAHHGVQPWAGLSAHPAGAFYGVTYYGGLHHAGEVFRISRNEQGRWTECVPYTFEGGADGSGPYGALLFDAAGAIYGTASQAGIYGGGTVFKLTHIKGCEWRLTVLHQFGREKDGNFPAAALTFDRRGNLYGTTEAGGAYNYGTIFELTRTSAGNWRERVVHDFTGAEGAEPWNSVVLDKAGNLFTTTSLGGKYNFGTVFELSPGTSGEWAGHVLHFFTGGSDGSEPNAGLVLDRAGNLYGASVYGGTHGRGNIFKLSRASDGSWKETVLHQFSGADGASPWDTPSVGVDGNLYGTAYEGGAGHGTVFELKRVSGSWVLITLYAFRGGYTGRCPTGSLIIDKAGNLYGTALRGGLDNAGLVFEITR